MSNAAPDDTTRTETAFHEAGHAVAAHALGFSHDLITIAPSDESGTAGQYASQTWRGTPVSYIREFDNDFDEYLRDELAVVLAGPIAQRHAFPAHDQVDDLATHAGDHEIIGDILLRLTGNVDEQDAMRKDGEQRAKALLLEHWRSVEAVAAHLLNGTGTLTGEQLSTLLEWNTTEKMQA